MLARAITFALELRDNHKQKILGARYFYRAWLLISSYNQIVHGTTLDSDDVVMRAELLKRFFQDRSINTTDRVDRIMFKDGRVIDTFLEEFSDEVDEEVEHDEMDQFDMRDHHLAFLIGVPEE